MNEQDTAIREFLIESYENLDQLERDLVTIEDDPRNRETLDGIFRTVHSIKGACGFLAYPKLEGVAHAGEGLLCRLRDGAMAWKPAITSRLLTLADAMRKILGQIEASGTEGPEEYAGLIGLLVGLQTSGDEPCAASGETGSAAPEPRVEAAKVRENPVASPVATPDCSPPAPQLAAAGDDRTDERDKPVADPRTSTYREPAAARPRTGPEAAARRHIRHHHSG